MHIQDGILSPAVCAVTGTLSLAAIGFSLNRVKASLSERTVPLTGMMAALVFAAQMVNFPIGAPVSGHLMGGVLAAIILGPWAGCLALTLVLVVQWALFADGGMLALGANVLHMAVIGSWGGYAVYTTVRRRLGNGFRGAIIGGVFAAWLSVMAAAALFCLEFRLSWHSLDYKFANIFALMVSFHSLIGVGEALITGSVVSFVLSLRPDLLYAPQTEPRMATSAGRFVVAGVVCSLAVAAFLSPFASEYADGLESVAERTGFDELGSTSALVWDGYDAVPMPLDSWQGISVSIAGIGGTLAVLVIALILGRFLKPQTMMVEAGSE